MTITVTKVTNFSPLHFLFRVRVGCAGRNIRSHVLVIASSSFPFLLFFHAMAFIPSTGASAGTSTTMSNKQPDKYVCILSLSHIGLCTDSGSSSNSATRLGREHSVKFIVRIYCGNTASDLCKARSCSLIFHI